MFYEVILEGIKKFAGEIVGVVLLILAWKKFNWIRSLFGQYDKLKDDSNNQPPAPEEQKDTQLEGLKIELQINQNRLKEEQTQKEEEIRKRAEIEKQLEAHRKEEERIKAEIQRQKEELAQIEAQKAEEAKRHAMSDKDFVNLCKSDNISEIEEAIKNGANVNAKNNDGYTALMVAVYNNNPEAADLLRSHGAEY